MIQYVTIEDYLKWQDCTGTGLDKAITFMSYYLGKSEDEIREMGGEVLKQYEEFSKLLEDTASPQFFPIIEIDGKLHGFCDITQMTLGEYVDLEKLAGDANGNLSQIMAILYRPILKHRFDSIQYNIVNTYNVYSKNKNLTNLWEYYELEPYTYSNAIINTEKMKKLPIGFGLGAVSFFLLQTSLLIKSSQDYSNRGEKMKMVEFMKKEKKEMNNVIKNNSVSIGDGLLQFIISRQLPSLTLGGEISLLRI
jgi:hypothetical protein